MANIHCVFIIIFASLTVLDKTTYAQDDVVGSQCTVSATGNPGTCKASTNCPEVEEQAKRGVTPTICGRLHYNLPIVCCENQFSLQPNDGTLLFNLDGNSQTNSGFGSISNSDNSNSQTGFNSRPSSNRPNNNFGTSDSNNGFSSNSNSGQSFSTDSDEGPDGDALIYYPSEATGGTSFNNQQPRISQRQCDEYNKQVTSSVSALPLLVDSSLTTYDVQKCKFNGIGLIVGGRPAAAGEFPYMAAIGFRVGGELEWKCGGTLISERFVLTAAHCTFSRDSDGPEVVRLGDIKLDTLDDGVIHADYAVESVITHPDYRFPKRYHDIALLKTRNNVEFNSHIRPACLYQKSNIDVTTAIATGWGSTEYLATETSNKLMKVSLDIYNRTVCEASYPPNRKNLPRGLISNMLCAGYLEGGRDTCQGDSGGPLVVTEPDNHCKFYIIGVTSFGKGCGIKNIAAVYTKVSEFIPWIEENVW